jgi:succinyl-CoA synthetase beta subunit
MYIGNTQENSQNTKKDVSQIITDTTNAFWQGATSILPQNPFNITTPQGSVTLSKQGINVTSNAQIPTVPTQDNLNISMLAVPVILGVALILLLKR